MRNRQFGFITLKMVTYCLLLLSLIIVVSCTTRKLVKPDIRDTALIEGPFDKVWTSLVSVLSDMTMPIEAIEKESGLITTKFVIFASGILADDEIKTLAVRPSVLLGTWSQGRYTLSIFVAPSGENTTKVRVRSHIEAFEDNVTKSWYVCYSKGILENKILDALKSLYNVKSDIKLKLDLDKK